MIKITQKRREYERQYRLNHKEHYQQYRLINRERLLKGKKLDYQNNKDIFKKRAKIWNEEHLVERKEYLQKYRHDNSEKLLTYGRKKRKNNQEKMRIYRNKWKRNNPEHGKLENALRNRLWHALKTNQKVGSAVRDLGCTIEELKIWLESQFQSGMTWDNWVFYGWHIDHKIPLSFFDLTNREQFLKACHYTNLQPMWGVENLRKGGVSRLKLLLQC